MLPLIFGIIILCMVPGYKAVRTSGKRTGIRVLSILNIIFGVLQILSMFGFIVLMFMKDLINNITDEVVSQIYIASGAEVADLVETVIETMFTMAPVFLIATLAVTIFAIFTAIYGLKNTSIPVTVGGVAVQTVQPVQPVQPMQPVQPAQPVQQAAPSNYQWYCASCGSMNPEGSNFCASCGAAKPQQ